MNSIGFDNFRRFANFPEMDLGDITLLVGGNNSGKSTLVKALLLCVDNARLMKTSTLDDILNIKSPKFRFDANDWHDVKIKTFSRAIHNRPASSLDNLLDDELTLPTKMRFTFTLGNFKFIIEVAGDKDKDEPTGEVTFISIEDRGNMVQYSANYAYRSMIYSVLGSTSERETLVQKLYKEYASAREELNALSEAGDDIAAISAQSEKVTSLEKQIEEFVNPDGNDLPEDFDYEQALKAQFVQSLNTRYTSTSWDLPMEDYIDVANENLLVHIIGNFIEFANNPGQTKPEGVEDPNEYSTAMQTWMYVQEAREALKQEVDKMRKSKTDLRLLLNSIHFEYITAHAANQNSIYNSADRNDYIAETVHEFVRENILKGQDEHRFVVDWMDKFGIGSDFEIEQFGGEAYRVIIKDADGYEVNLADKGMGSIQMMILLLRIATLLRFYRPKSMAGFYPTIIIEEPEQNLHPRVQSLLADLLLYLNKEYNCKFIIETHSEYLIRKTQVLVNGEKYEDDEALKENNPFKVYYFDAHNAKLPYYQMEYRTDGNFSNEFGTGFFDEANKLLYDIL